MSALAEALVAAQRRALSAMEKQYAAGKLTPDDVHAKLFEVGLTDTVDADRLIAALDLIRDYGAPLPAEPKANGDDGPRLISDAQRTYIGDLVKRAKVSAPDLAGLTHEQASALIDSLKNGTYDPSQWSVPF